MFRYYTGTFTNWSEGGELQPFAVANADEIPPSSKDIRITWADSVEHAIAKRFAAVQ
jgi:hypothetical protein